MKQDYDDIQNILTDYYLNDDYISVINTWESKINYKLLPKFDNKLRNEVLHALIISYKKTENIKQSIFYINKYINKLLNNHQNENFDEELLFCFTVLASIYASKQNYLKELKTLYKYNKFNNKNKKNKKPN